MKGFKTRKGLVQPDEPLPETCGVRGCKNKASRWWPLFEGNPCLCSHHSKNPPKGRWADLVEAADAPPDDFDIPY